MTDAIDLLTQQHEEVNHLFEEIQDADGDEKEKLFGELADALALHSTIEEQIFYPESKGSRTEEKLREAVEEHLSVKRILADMMELDCDDEQFDAKLTVLQEQVEHHVEEEEQTLFPQTRKLLGKKKLEQIGEELQTMTDELKQGHPREAIPGEIAEPAPLE